MSARVLVTCAISALVLVSGCNGFARRATPAAGGAGGHGGNAMSEAGNAGVDASSTAPLALRQ